MKIFPKPKIPKTDQTKLTKSAPTIRVKIEIDVYALSNTVSKRRLMRFLILLDVFLLPSLLLGCELS